jgi:hypothetical protein
MVREVDKLIITDIFYVVVEEIKNGIYQTIVDLYLFNC